jgi:uncharacterized protein (DUF2236 family)
MALVVQRVNRERVVLLGWSRAILMQLAHPLIAAGVVQHSSFRGGAVAAAVRLHHTVGAMLSLTFGSDERRAAAVAKIRAIHRTVNGTLGVSAGPFGPDTRYSAEDPALLLWVHATLLDSSVEIYERVVEPLEDADRDRLCIESAPLLEELGGDAATTPRCWRDLQAYMARTYDSGVLAVTDEARMLGTAVLSPRAAGVPLPLSGVHRLLSTGLLPPSLRLAYGFPWNEAREARFHRALRTLRTVRRFAPHALTHFKAAS